MIAGNMARHPALKDVNHRCNDLAHSSKIMDDGLRLDATMLWAPTRLNIFVTN